MMGDGVADALEKEVQRLNQALSKLTPGSKEYLEVLKQYDTLIQKRIELEQNEIKAFEQNEKVRLEGLKAEAEQNHRELMLDFEHEKLALEEKKFEHEKDKLRAEEKKNDELMKLEREKLEKNVAIENKKAGLTPGKALIEILKVGVPVLTAAMGYVAYDRFQNKNLQFEQEHVFKATTTKDLRMSNILPKR